MQPCVIHSHLQRVFPQLGLSRKHQNEWQDGGHNRSTIHGFSGAGTNFVHAVKFELDADEPAILLGQDQGPSAGEYLLHALAACVTTAIVYHAAARGIAIDEIESSIDGDVDLRGFLGIDHAKERSAPNSPLTRTSEAGTTVRHGAHSATAKAARAKVAAVCQIRSRQMFLMTVG